MLSEILHFGCLYAFSKTRMDWIAAYHGSLGLDNVLLLRRGTRFLLWTPRGNTPYRHPGPARNCWARVPRTP